TEGNSGTTSMNFTVTLSAVGTSPVVVDYTTTDVTATAGSDYVASSGVLIFNPGETSKMITIDVNGDTVFEPDETFTITLSRSVNAKISRAVATGTIINDDPMPSIGFGSPNYSVGDGDSVVNITVSLSNSSSQPTSVSYTTTDSAGSQPCNVFNGKASSRCDYITALGKLIFNPGETTKTISVLIIDDSYAEGPETFQVNVSGPTGGTIGAQSTTTVTINDNDTTT